ncbi:MAG: hypothetical protein OXG35_30655 [Acidobacteria bacterium]|nr:hypothetical protein [Acidobacteriota bacterium]
MKDHPLQRPPAPPNGRHWTHACRRDDPGAAPRWFPGGEPPSAPDGRDPYRVTPIVVDEDDAGCVAGVYLYWPASPETGESEEMVGPVRLDGERVLEELWRQHPCADEAEHGSLFEGIIEKMLTNHLVETCTKLWKRTQEPATMGYAEIDKWTRKVEDAAEKTRSWRVAHG